MIAVRGFGNRKVSGGHDGKVEIADRNSHSSPESSPHPDPLPEGEGRQAQRLALAAATAVAAAGPDTARTAGLHQERILFTYPTVSRYGGTPP